MCKKNIALMRNFVFPLKIVYFPNKIVLWQEFRTKGHAKTVLCKKNIALRQIFLSQWYFWVEGWENQCWSFQQSITLHSIKICDFCHFNCHHPQDWGPWAWGPHKISNCIKFESQEIWILFFCWKCSTFRTK